MADTTRDPTRPRGPRRRGDARADILAAARRLFAERGFEGTSLRAVAREADVDPALVHHYFDSKTQLFTASMGVDGLDFSQVAEVVLAAGRDGVPEALIRAALGIWSQAAIRQRLQAMLSSIVGRPEVADMMRGFVIATLLRPITESLRVDEPERRAALVASQMVGLGMARFVIRLEPIASADPDMIVADVAPTIRRYLFEPLG